MSKISPKAEEVYNRNGLQIFVSPFQAKKLGKDHIWIQIRQPGKKVWRVYTTLSYKNAVDINMESVNA